MYQLRRFIGLHWMIRGFIFPVIVLSFSQVAKGQALTHGPVLGAVTDEGIKVWARSDNLANYELRYSPTSGGTEFSAGTTSLASASDFTGVLNISGLSSATDYDYRVLLDGNERFSGTFTTLPTVGEPGKISFAYGADLNPAHQPFGAFNHIVARQPDFMILGGDQVYADSAPDTKSGYESFYKNNWSDLSLRSAQQRIPMFMMWDDHEITNNWSAGQTGRYTNARSAFDEYQGSYNPDPIVPNELYYSYSAGEVDFFVLDTRSHRSPNGMAAGPAKTMLGATQRTELLNWLDSSEGKFKFIVSSVPFNQWSTTGNDSWYQGFRNERDLIFDHIRDEEIGGVVLLSGDQHWSGAFRLNPNDHPYSLYEFQPTPTGIGNRNEPSSSDSQILYKSDDYKGFGLFTVDTTPAIATLDYQWIDENGNERFSLQINEDDIFVDLSDVFLKAAVHRDTGEIVLSNESTFPIEFDYYQIDSEANSLDESSWSSLDEQGYDSTGQDDGQSWNEAGGSNPSSIGELYLQGSTSLLSGQAVSIGNAYNTMVDSEDLALTFRLLPNGRLIDGIVQYVGEPGFTADFNGDGAVNHVDLQFWEAAFGSDDTGDADSDGDSDGTDFLIWQRQVGMGGGTVAIPEPSAFGLILLATITVSIPLMRQTADR